VPLRIQVLNHAAALIELGGVRLLSDPWFEGTCFSGGWGLRYDNPEAYDAAADATHLWISHWHSDHLHAPTLAKLAQRNPRIRVLANVSANFSMLGRLAAFGFGDVVELGERAPLQLEDGVSVTRYPTAGIDNMLHVQGHGWSVLNYNDCNLPAAGVRALRRSIGRVDVLLTNYNHAGKLFRSAPPEEEKRAWYANMPKVADLFDASCVIPFASSHHYRCALSAEQNASLLSFDDIEAYSAGDTRLCVLRMGDAIELDSPTAAFRVTRREPPVPMQAPDVHDYGASVPLDELIATCATRCAQLKRNFGALVRLVPPLRVAVSDQDTTVELDLRGGARQLPKSAAQPHIEAHSQALTDWLGRRFGDDTFFAGAHFGLRDADTTAIERWALVTLLEASHLDPRSMFEYLRSKSGLRFLWCRREEIASSVLTARVKAAQVRL
jgi:L-ascorbate metabolism protein UlaG (beta-lactamase superfamily)